MVVGHITLSRTLENLTYAQTHNVALVSSIADFVVALKDGTVVSQGTLLNVLAQDTSLLADATSAEKQFDADEPAKGESGQVITKDADGKLVVEEEVSEGHVGWSACECHRCRSSASTN